MLNSSGMYDRTLLCCDSCNHNGKTSSLCMMPLKTKIHQSFSQIISFFFYLEMQCLFDFYVYYLKVTLCQNSKAVLAASSQEWQKSQSCYCCAFSSFASQQLYQIQQNPTVIQLFECQDINPIQSYLPLNISFQREELIKNPLPDTRTITNIIPIIQVGSQSKQIQRTLESSFHKEENNQPVYKSQQKSQNQIDGNQVQKSQIFNVNNYYQNAELNHSNSTFLLQNKYSLSKHVHFQEQKPVDKSQIYLQQTSKITYNLSSTSISAQNVQPIQVQNAQQNNTQQQKEIDEDQFDDISVSIADQDMRELDQEYGVKVPTEQEVNKFIELLLKACPQTNFQSILCAINTLYNYCPSNQPQIHSDFNDNHSIAASSFSTRPVASDFHGSNYSYGFNNTSNNSNINGYQTPSFLNQNHPDYRPSFHSIQSQKYIRRHRARRDFDCYGFDPKKSPEYRQNLERRIAYVFVTKGYGLGVTRQTLKQDVQNNLYNSLLTSVLRVSLRKLCDLLTNHLKLNIQVFDSKDEIQLRSPMANCRKWMDQKDLGTFYKIIAQIYSLNKQSQHIYPQQLVSLYNSICRQQLNKKVYFNTNTTSTSRQPINFGTSSKANGYHYQKEQIIPSKQITVENGLGRITPGYDPVNNKQAYQKELLLQYLKYGNIERITEMLNLKYKQKSTPENGMIVIQKVIQNGLKNVVTNYSSIKKKMPHLPILLLNDHIIGFIMRDRKNNKFRVTIIKLLNQLRIHFNEKIGSVVSYINSYVNTNNLTALYTKSADEQKYS